MINVWQLVCFHEWNIAEMLCPPVTCHTTPQKPKCQPLREYGAKTVESDILVGRREHGIAELPCFQDTFVHFLLAVSPMSSSRIFFCESHVGETTFWNLVLINFITLKKENAFEVASPIGSTARHAPKWRRLEAIYCVGKQQHKQERRKP